MAQSLIRPIVLIVAALMTAGCSWWPWGSTMEEPPAAHLPNGQQAFPMRGLVKFRWKENGSIVRRATRTTTSGHKASPKAYSAATCKISGPPARQTVPQQSTTSAR